MNTTSTKTNSPEAGQLQVAAQEIARLRNDLQAILTAHKQFGQLEKGSSGLGHSAKNLVKKATRATEMLRRCRPMIVSEFGPKSLLSASGISGEEYLRFLVDLGYDMQVVDEKKLIPGGIPEVLALHKKSGIDHIDVLFRPR